MMKMLLSRQSPASPQQLIIHALLLIAAFITLFPFYWMVITSFKTPNEVFTSVFHWLPQVWNGTENYLAAVSKAPILVLDEATSSVDTRTEMHIDHGMERLMKDRTTFVIAHRLSTVRNADCIMVLEQGEIIERGTHEQLLAEKGRYYQLYTGAVELD